MAEVDPVTGQPLSISDQDKKAEKYAQANEKKAKADQLRADLDSDVGKSVMSCIEEQFLSRVNKLINEDPECLAYKKIISGMGVTLSFGDKAVKDLMRLLIKK
jgi:ribosomal protein S25